MSIDQLHDALHVAEHAPVADRLFTIGLILQGLAHIDRSYREGAAHHALVSTARKSGETDPQ